MAPNTSSAGNLLFNLIAAVLRLPTALRELGQVIDGYTRRAYLALKRKAIHFLKATGILITIAFAGASLYYAKTAADGARCQLELQKRQYCEAASDDMKQKYPCDYILAQDIVQSIWCCCGGPDTRLWELIFTIPWPYFQTYVRAYCSQRLLDGKPWWHRWGPPYTTVYFRPILWRFPDAYWIAEYLNGPLGVTSAIVGSFIVVMACARNRQGGFVALRFYLMLVVIPVLLSSLLLFAELGRQNDYLCTSRFQRGFHFELPQNSGCSLLSEYLSTNFVGRFLIPGLNRLQSRSFLGVLDSITDEPYRYNFWIQEPNGLRLPPSLGVPDSVTKAPYGNWMLWRHLLEMAYTIFAVIISFVAVAPVRRATATGDNGDDGDGERQRSNSAKK